MDSLVNVESSTERKIERQYPAKKWKISYPPRYDSSTFERLNEMNKDTKLQDSYKKWKDGINSETNRKIKIGGKTHRALKSKFIIYKYGMGNVLFDELNINDEREYLKETEKIIAEIDIENKIIKEYNQLVDSVIEKIQKLERWSDFIEFDGKYYGITSTVLNNIHLENDCFGEMIFIRKETTYTTNCRPFCWTEDTETISSIYKCCLCDYEYRMVECVTGGGSLYASTSERK